MRLLWFVSEPAHEKAFLTHFAEALTTQTLLHRRASEWDVPPSCDCFEISNASVTEVDVNAWAEACQTDVLCLNSPPPKLALFDMDSTLIQHEVIDELASEFGLGAQVSAITARAMRGELDFVESFTERLGLLAGLSESALESVYARLQLMPGADVLMANLRAGGVRTGIVSGGFSFFAERFQARLGMDFVLSNPLQCVDGQVTGRVIPPVIDGSVKESTLRSEAQAMGLELADTLAVGDGANDIPMLLAAGTGVAFHAKPAVAAGARHVMRYQDLSALSYLLPAPTGA